MGTRRAFSQALLAGVTGRAAGSLLKGLKRAHPRLMMDGGDLARIRKLVRTAPDPGRWYSAIRAEADQILKQPPSRYEIPDGRRLLSVSRRVKERVQTLALVFQIDGGRHYVDRVWAEIEAAAKFRDWNPSHFLDTAEMTYAFAIAYDWLYPQWSPEQRRAMREAIVSLGLKPGLRVYEAASGWHKRNNNWNQVCNGGLGIGALAIADEEPELAERILSEALRSIPIAMRHYAPDGAGTEGATYWDYGARFNIKFLSSLESALGTDFGLSATEGFAESGLYQIYMAGAGRLAMDFADCGLRRLSTPMHFWMARKFKRPEYSWFRLCELARPEGHGSVLDLLWFDESGRGYDPSRLPLDKHFRGAECASMRSSWTDPNALVIGLQAGYNENLSGHRHLDLGSFILEAAGERWFIDSGVEHETYMSHRHRNPRWSYYRIRAEGHNTLVINPDGGPDQDPAATAKIRSFESRPERAAAIVDLTRAYAKHARRVERIVSMHDRAWVVITDRIEADRPAEVWWFAHTEAEIANGGRRAVLARAGKRFPVEILRPEGAVFEVMEAAPLPSSPNPAVQASNKGRRKLAVRFNGVTNLELAVKFGPA